MFKLRRRAVAEAAATDQPFCAMCGTNLRVDATTGRCALGHRVLPANLLPLPSAVEDELTAVIVEAPESSFDETAALEVPVMDEAPAAAVGEGLYEAYQSADAAGRNVTWDDVVAPTSKDAYGVYDDYLSWDEPAGGFASSLDVEAESLIDDEPVAQADDQDEPVAYDTPAAPAAPVRRTLEPSDLLDELDDDDEEARAKRRTAGTVGAAIAVTGMFAGAIAILPF